MKPHSACLLALSIVLSACSSTPPGAQSPSASVLAADLLQSPLSDLDGKPLVLADELKTGKMVTLVFWQTWCASCRAEAPELIAASKKYTNMQVIGVVSGPDEDVDALALERAVREWGLTYRNLRDRSLELTRALKVTGTPTIVVLDAGGQVLYNGHKLPDWDALL